jgi:aryl-alcohol dehydrogenase-like predicted oxidoreductase
MYNAITRSLEQELIPACKRYGLDVVIYNPLAGGIFSGAYATSFSVASVDLVIQANTRLKIYPKTGGIVML